MRSGNAQRLNLSLIMGKDSFLIIDFRDPSLRAIYYNPAVLIEMIG